MVDYEIVDFEQTQYYSAAVVVVKITDDYKERYRFTFPATYSRKMVEDHLSAILERMVTSWDDDAGVFFYDPHYIDIFHIDDEGEYQATTVVVDRLLK